MQQLIGLVEIMKENRIQSITEKQTKLCGAVMEKKTTTTTTTKEKNVPAILRVKINTTNASSLKFVVRTEEQRLFRVTETRARSCGGCGHCRSICRCRSGRGGSVRSGGSGVITAAGRHGGRLSGRH